MSMSFIDFENSRANDKKRQWEREARNAILDKAKNKYEADKLEEEGRRQRGEHTWMLPSVEAKLDSESSSKKKKKKKDKKKKKKKAKKRRDSSSSSSSESDGDAAWVEKPSASAPVKSSECTVNKATGSRVVEGQETSQETSKREGWMEMTSLFKTYSRDEIKEKDGTSRKKEKEEEKRRKQEADKPGSHALELNPYFKDGGSGLPEQEKQKSSTPAVGLDAGWLRKALKRAKEQAQLENKSLEEIAAARWGSLAKFNELLAEAEGRTSNRTGESKQRRNEPWKETSQSRSRDRYRSYSRERKRSSSRDRKRSSSRDRKRSKSRERRSRSKEKTRHRKRYDCSNSSSSSGSSSDSSSSNKHGSSKTNRSGSYRKQLAPENSRRGVSGLMKPPEEDFPVRRSSALSSKFHKPGEEPGGGHGARFGGRSTTSARFGSNSTTSSSRGWQKKEPVQEERDKRREQPKQDSSSSSSSSSEISDEELPHTEDVQSMDATNPSVKPPSESQVFLTDKEMNELAAKIMKAELLGNDTLASKLKSKLEGARSARVNDPANIGSTIEQPADAKEEVVILTRTDAKGFSRPVNIVEPEKGKKKPEKMKTHGKDGKRLRYFPDDDKHDLKQMFEEEKSTTAEDQNSMFNRAAMQNTERLNDDYDMDDMFMSKAVMKENSAKQAERDKNRAIKDHQRSTRSLEACQWCFENKEMAKHLIIALGTKAYVCLPPHESLTPGHCLIVPIHHAMCAVQADEDLWSEIQSFRRSLVKMFNSRDEDCIFFETAKRLRNYPHMVLNCVPLPKETGDMAPIYFKKAIMECEAEWAQNKKLVDLKNRDVRRAVPKGLPYFFVDFAMDPGYAHVIEDEQDFPHNFAQEIVGGMLDLENNLWRKPRKENFDVQRRKVMEFSRWYKEFDITQDD